MKIEFNPYFEIGETVYHKLDSRAGIVKDIIYNVRTKFIQYFISFGLDVDIEGWYDMSELSDTKQVY